VHRRLTCGILREGGGMQESRLMSARDTIREVSFVADVSLRSGQSGRGKVLR
jgi:hypothetical protein